jgi:hypothetical protein
MGPLGVVELECPGDRLENARGCAGERATFELGVVLDAHAGQRRDLAASQAGNPASRSCG